jgi:hypothetical protein
LARVRGLEATSSTQFFPSSPVQSTTAKPIPIRASASLARKVMVTTRPGS